MGKEMKVLPGGRGGRAAVRWGAQDADRDGSLSPGRPQGEVGSSPLQGLCAILAGVAPNLIPGGLDVVLVGGRQHHGCFFLSLGRDQKCAGRRARSLYAWGAPGAAARAALIGGRGAARPDGRGRQRAAGASPARWGLGSWLCGGFGCLSPVCLFTPLYPAPMAVIS